MDTQLIDLLIHFGFNFLIALCIVRFIYYPSTHKKAYVFTYLVFNTIIFFVMRFMRNYEIGVGVGFGLFGVFSILRYRTTTIPIREMTYLFILVALPVMNSVNANNELWWQLVVANAIIVAIMAILEKGWGFHYEISRQVEYEKIALIHPTRHAELKADLEKRLGQSIKRLEIGKINFLRDTATVRIWYDGVGYSEWTETGAADDDD